ncbi:MAG: Flp family type IVb pilin [Verrucomicrobiota bacterium]|nr:Flp family type IVb pilin [Verrucomicrobiota bacterium]
MKSMQIRRKKESGQSLVEYGLILGLIVVVVIVIMGTMGGKIKDIFSDVSDQIPVVTEDTTTTGS